MGGEELPPIFYTIPIQTAIQPKKRLNRAVFWLLGKDYEIILEQFENLNDSVVRDISKDEPEWFVQERLESLESFNRTNDDSFKYGMTMKTDISGIKISDYKSKVNIIVRNKDDRITVDDFKESLEKNPGLIREYFMKKTKKMADLMNGRAKLFLLMLAISTNK